MAVAFKKTPHPNLPPQGGKALLLERIRSNPLPPCGGGLGWGVSFLNSGVSHG